MVACDICDKEFKNTQGLRGHKTFVHGLYANHDKPAAELTFRQRIDENRSPVKSEKNSTSEFRDRLEKLENKVISNTELLTEVRQTVSELQQRLALKATRSEINRIATIVETLGKQLEKHDHWLNPESTDEVILEIIGGPIGYLKKCIEDLSSSRQIKGSG